MPTITVITRLKARTFLSFSRGASLGDVMVSTNDITQINNKNPHGPNITGLNRDLNLQRRPSASHRLVWASVEVALGGGEGCESRVKCPWPSWASSMPRWCRSPDCGLWSSA